ncbi:formyltetrahydrofolate deformylase [Geodermatophilus sabuli]|uniref:Formyltetrahydrofolate deformylase n=1 Tax=Geodermatophilus sabuli TaxID=1564158 RepID=A0A7K3VXJ6_9ACTN|nr:formyltetrahydrofolate deformylase [Geodermatophilus sabuli]
MTTPSTARSAVLTLSCPDVPGIVHAVTGFLVEHDATITQSSQFDDLESCNFFMRVQFAPTTDAGLDVAALCQAFEPVAQKFGMTWRLEDTSHRERVIIMVSKFAHCLNDLLFRNSVGDLNLDVVAVVSNHPDLKPLADHYGVPFKHIPVTKDTKDAAEAELLDMVREQNVELVILARYMQILSDNLCRQLAGHAINIHHSMLPAFKGAKPYHQAHDRGVKFIGATAHYVTADLDEGPIIEQDIQRVDHSMDADTFVARGRESECRALARAVRWHTENRVQLNGNRTVVLQ